MSAFGRRPGTAGRPAFGVAKPMQGGSGVPGGAQFPAIETPPAIDIPQMPSNLSPEEEAMERLNQRSTAEMAEPEKAQGFEASVHKIKEQVLPRLLERVDPEAAATLTKDELSEEFRPIILEVLAELKVTLNRREQFALEKVLIDELLDRGHDVQIFATRFRPMKHTLGGRQEQVMLKLVVDRATRVVLGVHMVGADAPEIVQAAAIAVTMGATKDDFDRTLAVHPTVAEELVLLR